MKLTKALVTILFGVIITLTPHAVRAQQQSHRLHARADCRTIEAEEGDGCESLAKRCDIGQKELTKFNSAEKFCNNIIVGQQVCCSAGELPDLSPKPDDDGNCATYTIKEDDDCATIATKNHMKKEVIERRLTEILGDGQGVPISSQINAFVLVKATPQCLLLFPMLCAGRR